MASATECCHLIYGKVTTTEVLRGATRSRPALDEGNRLRCSARQGIVRGWCVSPPNVRQREALLAPACRAARMASSCSALIACGRPPRFPRRRAASSPARMRSCANAPKTRNRNAPCGVVVSIGSVRERHATPCACKVVITWNRCDSERPSRSSFQMTRQSPGRTEASACWSPGRSSRAPLALSSHR